MAKLKICQFQQEKWRKSTEEILTAVFNHTILQTLGRVAVSSVMHR
jgi:hypothetical protein